MNLKLVLWTHGHLTRANRYSLESLDQYLSKCMNHSCFHLLLSNFACVKVKVKYSHILFTSIIFHIYLLLIYTYLYCYILIYTTLIITCYFNKL